MDQTVFAEDLAVLAHLRGYPEDLRHYSNLIKQAHPRGLSALALVLRRPQASDSLIAAVCRYIAEGTPIASAVEAAELFGLPPAQFLDQVASRADFPRPLFAVEHRRLWRRADLEAYRAQGGPGGG
ncbi:MAG: hypothetical protein QN120_04755 [Armatimonadota bacterium]|nr:hypothetical protein [Armatimonadota bacterium]